MPRTAKPPRGLKIARRERQSILAAILGAIEAEASGGRGAKPTPIASRANIAYDRLAEYLTELHEMGLIEGDEPLLTQQGRDFLKQYRHFVGVLERYGFSNVERAGSVRASMDASSTY